MTRWRMFKTVTLRNKCKAQAELCPNVTVWAVNKDWHQYVAGKSYENETLVRVKQFVGGLVRTQDWHGHGLGSSHAEGCNQRQLLGSSQQFVSAKSSSYWNGVYRHLDA